MPTKPITTYTFATDAVFGSGPAVGLATKIIPPSLLQGFIPDTGIASEHVNYLHNIVGSWITDWLSQGSTTADEDAHIVETDAAGRARIANAIFGGHSSAFFPSAQVLQSTEDIAAAVGFQVITTLANAPGVYFSTNTAQPSMLVDRSAGGFAPASRFEGNTLGQGATFGSAADTVNDAAGLNLEARGTIPGGPASAVGDLWYSSDHEALQLVAGGSTPVVHAGSGALVHRSNTDLAEDSTTVSGTPIAKVSVTFGVGENLRAGRRVYIRASCEVGQNNTNLGACQIGLRDMTAGVDIQAPRTVRTFQSTGDASEKSYVIQSNYILPADGAREIALTYISDGNGANTMYIRNAAIEVEGQYVL